MRGCLIVQMLESYNHQHMPSLGSGHHTAQDWGHPKYNWQAGNMTSTAASTHNPPPSRGGHQQGTSCREGGIAPVIKRDAYRSKPRLLTSAADANEDTHQKHVRV